MHINAPLFNIHQCYALLAAGPRPHGSMRSLPRSFVWHGCRCLEHEIKLVTVIGNTYVVVYSVCVWICASVRLFVCSCQLDRSLQHVDVIHGNLTVCKLMTKKQKFSQLFPHWWSVSEREERKKDREYDGARRMSKRVRWRQLCLGACNWVLIELAPKDGWMDREMETDRVWVNWTSSLSPLSNTNVGLPCRQISWQQIRIKYSWVKTFGWNESFSCHFNETAESVVSHTFQMKLVLLEMYNRGPYG